jgi:hypothetical protein
LTPLLLSAVLAGAAHGQNVLLVSDAGPFSNVQAAVDAGLEGDVILVRTRMYGSFTIDGKSLTVVDDSQSIPLPVGTFIFQATVKNLTSSQSVSIRGFRGALGIWSIFTQGKVLDCAGPVLWEDCDFGPKSIASEDEFGLSVVNSSSVTVRRSVLGGGQAGLFESEKGDGLYVKSSNVYLFDSIAVGGKGADGSGLFKDGAQGGAGAHVVSGTLWALQTSFIGGPGGSGSSLPPQGKGGKGGNGFTALSTASGVTLLSCTFVKGPAGQGPAGPGTAGVETSIECNSVVASTPVKSFTANAPIVEGGTLRLEFDCGAPSSLFLFGADHPGPALLVGGVEGALLFDLASCWAVDLTGAAACEGRLTFEFVLPPNVPALEALTFTVQPLFADPGLTNLFLGAPSTFVVLDSAY